MRPIESCFSATIRFALLCGTICVSLFASGSVRAQQQEAASQKYALSIAAPTLEQLNVLAQILGNVGEMFFCLTGSVDGNRARIDGVFVPLQFSFADGVNPDGESCPQKTVAWWHNHPRGLCALSVADATYAIKLQKVPFIVIHTDGNEYCWWSREQIIILTKGVRQVDVGIGLYALPGQLVIKGSPK